MTQVTTLAPIAAPGRLYSFAPKIDPVITLNPSDVTVEDAQIVIFTAAADNALFYQWQRSRDGGATWTDMFGEVLTTLTFYAVEADSQSLYRMCARTGDVTVYTTAATLLFSQLRAFPMVRFGNIGTQYFDSNGDPLAGGKLFFYETGTNTLATTYTSDGATVENANPVILSADGRQPEIFFSGYLKCVLTDSNDVQVEERDPVGTISGDEYWIHEFPIATSSFTGAGVNSYYFIDMTGGSITLTLPGAPSEGDRLGFKVVAFSGNTLTVDRNGLNIEGAASDLVVTAIDAYELIYTDATNGWVITNKNN